MSTRYKGSILSAIAAVTSAGAAPGIWKTNEQMQGASSGTWPGYTTIADYLVVAGGGAGGFGFSGGGGAGGVISGSMAVVPGASYTVTVGAGSSATTSTLSTGTGQPSALSLAADSSYSAAFNAASFLRKSGSGVITAANNDVTIECWLYSNTAFITGLFDSAPGQVGALRNLNNNQFGTQYGDSTGVFIQGLFPISTWFHLAITYSGTVIKAFVNGIHVATGSSTGSWVVGNNFDIGAVNGNTAYFNGYISNFRVTNRILYTTNFAPPTSALTAIADTTLLTLRSPTLLDLSPNAYTVAVAGGSVSMTSAIKPPFGITAFGGGRGGSDQSKNGLSGGSGGGAAYLSGSTGGLAIPNEQGYAGGAGDSNNNFGGGGGGAGGAGIGGTNSTGVGGIGLSSSITGTATYYAGGGGGWTRNNASTLGGAGGGGNGSSGGTNTAGGTNTGGGGGGGGGSSNGAAGGSGVVIIRVPADVTVSATTGSPTVTTPTGYRVYKFTGNGSITF
jgi:hypothetical protein